ncbi:restriction endonuclease [Streptomyces sp. NBC_01142]|uniref:restriction endonuclease n=1 Tax=Streptomyces sp. NBC_01142 TaxID=2975865 RepID=UPI0022523EEF|nr:restriction endonuclease [Streptomyces sp. NBC_01142]MCX4820947.1 restriction endonuclease [Streptomyces sp. NBC_01142]
MTVPVRRPGAAKRRRAFSLRQLALFFGLVALALCAAGLTLKLTVRAVEAHPAAVVVVAVVVIAAAVGLSSARRRRAAGDVADGLVDLTHRIAERNAVEQERPPTAGVVEAPGETFVAADYAAMDPVSFEQAVAALCERDGCRDVEVVGGAGDLGADIMAIAPDGRRVVIQCKRYGPLNKVGSQDMQRFGGTCFAVHEAHVAAVVTTGEFTQPAVEYAEQCGIRCLDHHQLLAWTDGSGPAPWGETEAELHP